MNILKIFSVVFVSIMHVFCLGMDKQLALPQEVALKAVSKGFDVPTQRNIRATSRFARDNVIIPEDVQKIEAVEFAQCFLRPEKHVFRIKSDHEKQTYSDKDEMNEAKYNLIKGAFAVIDRQEDDVLKRKTAKRQMLEQNIQPNFHGLKYQYTLPLLKTAIYECSDISKNSFAVGLIEANPYGFAGGSDTLIAQSYDGRRSWTLSFDSNWDKIFGGNGQAAGIDMENIEFVDEKGERLILKVIDNKKPEVISLLDADNHIPKEYVDLCHNQPKSFHDFQSKTGISVPSHNKMCIIS